MTDSLGELRAVLAGVGERLGEALGYAATARDRLSDALGLLTASTGSTPNRWCRPSCGARATSSTAGCA